MNILNLGIRDPLLAQSLGVRHMSEVEAKVGVVTGKIIAVNTDDCWLFWPVIPKNLKSIETMAGYRAPVRGEDLP